MKKLERIERLELENGLMRTLSLLSERLQGDDRLLVYQAISLAEKLENLNRQKIGATLKTLAKACGTNQTDFQRRLKMIEVFDYEGKPVEDFKKWFVIQREVKCSLTKGKVRYSTVIYVRNRCLEKLCRYMVEHGVLDLSNGNEPWINL